MRPGHIKPATNSASVLLGAGLAHHQAGRLKDAEAIYRQILAAAPNSFDATHLLGVIALQTGRLEDAGKLIAAALALNPASAPALNNLGNVFLRQGKLDDALVKFARAVHVQPALGDAQLNLGNLLRRQGKLNDAASHLKRAAAIDPRSINAHSNLGAVLLELRDAEGAVKAFETAVRLGPDQVDGYSNLGAALIAAGELSRAVSVLGRASILDPEATAPVTNRGLALARLGRLAEARMCFEQVVAAEPKSAAAYCNLGASLRDAGAYEQARTALRHALTLDPHLVEAHLALTQTLRDAGDDLEAQEQLRLLQNLNPQSASALVQESMLCLDRKDRVGAEAALRRALVIEPTNADAHYQLGNVLMFRGRQAEAIKSYQSAKGADQNHVQARWAIVMAQIPPVPADISETPRSRAAFARELRDLDKWFTEQRVTQGYKAVGSTQPFYLAYQALNNRELLAQYGALCARLMKSWQSSNVIVEPRQPLAHSGPVRVGIASAHINDHSVWNAIIKGWVKHLDRGRFEIYLFNLDSKNDHETALARQWAHNTEDRRRGLAQWSQCIADSKLDVLIYPEIGMDRMTVQLAAQRLAPVQVATWGHPETTGMPTMDFYLSAMGLEPTAAAAHYTERLVMLPNLGVCYEPASVLAELPDLAAIGLPLDTPLMLCPGMPFKYSPEYDKLWIEIARRTGSAHLVFFRPDNTDISERFEQRLRNVFAIAKVEFDQRVSFVPFLGRSHFHGLMQYAYLFLDSPGFSGFNTVMQAMECGLPVVSFEGSFLRGRLGSGILRRLGMDELVVNSQDSYIDVVAAMMANAEHRQRARDRIVEQRHLLFDDRSPIAALERFLEDTTRQIS